MKHTAKLLISFILILTMTGCGDNGNSRDRANNVNTVDKIISEQMEKDDTSSEEQSTDTAPNPGANKENSTIQNTGGVDYDLTTMSSDMVYATVYQMMADPDTYIGKTFRMEGIYCAFYDRSTAKYYHCCLIQDALACCSQGLEFVWGDGNHIFPDEYPENNTEVIVQGVYETYQEDGDPNLYCRLKDAALEVVDN